MPATVPSLNARCGKRVVGEVDVRADGAQQLARLRPDHGHRRPLLGDRRAVDLEIRPLGLQPLLQPGQHARRAAGGRGHVEMAWAKPRGHAVVEHHAVVAQHQPVAAAADLELGPGVGVDAVQQLGGVRDPAGRSCPACSRRTGRRRCAPRRHSRCTAACMSSPRLREVARALPVADILEHRALRRRPGVARRAADRVEQLDAVRPGEGAER